MYYDYIICSITTFRYIFLPGNSSKGPEKDYSISNDKETRIFGVFNAIAIIATTFGNGIIPEIQVSSITVRIYWKHEFVGTDLAKHVLNLNEFDELYFNK